MNIILTETDREILKRHSQSVRGRALLELIIVDELIRAAKKSKYKLEIDDADEGEKIETADDFKRAVFNRDDALINVHLDTRNSPSPLGWIRLVFGNDGYDLISDYSTNLEVFLAPVNAIAKLLGG